MNLPSLFNRPSHVSTPILAESSETGLWMHRRGNRSQRAEMTQFSLHQANRGSRNHQHGFSFNSLPLFRVVYTESWLDECLDRRQ